MLLLLLHLIILIPFFYLFFVNLIFFIHSFIYFLSFFLIKKQAELIVTFECFYIFLLKNFIKKGHFYLTFFFYGYKIKTSKKIGGVEK